MPKPVVGDSYIDGVFGPPIERIFKISAARFWARWDNSEVDALIAHTNPQAATFVRRLEITGILKGTKTEIKTIGQGLVTLGILSASRAREIFKESDGEIT